MQSRTSCSGRLLGRMVEVVDGVRIERPAAATGGDEPAPVRAYLESVAVTGFRGIGPTCELRLQPGPGLTLVVGRNGSGKSSFAEAAEFALTGDSLRWSGKSQEWKSGWRNLHAEADPQIKVSMRVEGEREPRVVRVTWASDKLESAKTEVTIPGEGRHSLDSLGWGTPLKSFRPFLSYAELATITGGRPVDRYNALAPMLGMESLRGPLEDLRQARLAAQKQIDAAHDAVDAAREMPALAECADGRPAEAAEALRGRWALDRIEALVAGTEPAAKEREQLLAALEHIARPDLDRVGAAASDLCTAAETLDALRGSGAEHARKLAGMLDAAIEIHDRHGDSDCPVWRPRGRDFTRPGLWSCGTRSSACGPRRAQSTTRSKQTAMPVPRRRLRWGCGPRSSRRLEPMTSGVDVSELQAVWEAWFDAPEPGAELAAHLESTYLPLAEATDAVRLAAGTRRQQLADQWRPIAERLTGMLPDARAGQQAEQRLPALKNAEGWLKRSEAAIRDARFDVVKSQVTGVWDTLSIGSNVTLEDVSLGAKKVNMDVTVDGASAGALGVMSQGELNALALSLFVPRVTFDDSPFRFAMVDDPVQAMDPVRVDGLAQCAARAWPRRIRSWCSPTTTGSRRRYAPLQMPATILSVTRRPDSQVELKKSLDPIQGAIEDARPVELSRGLPDEVRRRVVPGLCRQVIEAACLESGRRRLLAGGMRLDECEETWAAADKLLPRVAIGLYGDLERAGDVYGTLNNRFGRWAGDTVRDCNEMTHSGAGAAADLRDLVSRAESLAAKLAAP